GTYEGRKLFSATASREMWTPHTVFSGISEQAEKFNPTRHFNLYGLGWLLSDYQGRLLVSHGGGLDGMTSQFALMPEESSASSYSLTARLRSRPFWQTKCSICF
ncbi:MAG: hypothetical protein H0W34_06470, partial [Pyrinomonadaceae bacterium]|nr:hypothetical protein [Pyrinomonadaceae bacterium]